MKSNRFFALFLGIMLLEIFSGCTSKNANGNMSNNEETTSSVEAESKLEGTSWFYSQREDDLTHEITSINAMILSTNRVRINSYGNTARMSISLSYSMDFSPNPLTSVMFAFVDDNNLCRLSDFQGSGILAVFDDGEVDDRWTLINMGKKRNALYMYHPSKVAPFVSRLKESQHVRIQVNLEGVGKNTFDFNIGGLKWDFNE